MKPRLLVAFGALALVGAPASARDVAPTSCIACHGDADLFGAEGPALVEAHAGDVHARSGISCHDCHGGDPALELAQDAEASMDPRHPTRAFRPGPARRDHPAFCGRCHGDPTFMRRYRPDARVDQEQEYWTSHHGLGLRRGDDRVATCIDCHGSHGILESGDSRSSVHPRRVADTCNRCHGDAAQMAGYETPDGRPLPVDQYARWRQSVHAAALIDREDLSAPTCNDCHGNHGAAPPGLASIGHVCGQCHGREAEIFRASGKRAGFENHNELLVDAGPDSCGACHGEGEPQSVLRLHALTECASCHDNHAVIRPSVAMLSPLPRTPCAFCHEAPEGSLIEVDEDPERTANYEETRDALLEAASDASVSEDRLFDWLLAEARELPFHATGASAEREGEFARLLRKFRIGETHYSYQDPASGERVRRPVLGCAACHGDPDGAGLTAARTLLERLRELTVRSARAERIVLAARRGGVETREAGLAIDHSIDAQIELQVLLHSFSTEPGSAFAERHEAGLGQAREALEAGQAAGEELAARRHGLAISLVFVALVLVGLALKIRETSA